MTVQEFALMMDGYVEEKEEQLRQDWDRARWIAAVLLSPHTQKGKRIQPTDLARFPWDKTDTKKVTKAQQEFGEHILKTWSKASQK